MNGGASSHASLDKDANDQEGLELDVAKKHVDGHDVDVKIESEEVHKVAFGNCRTTLNLRRLRNCAVSAWMRY